MRTKQTKWHFTDKELEWLNSQSPLNELVTDILYRYNLANGKKATKLRDFRYRVLLKHLWY